MTDRDRTLKDIISDITEQELAEKCPDVVITRDQLHQKIKKHRKRRLKKPVTFAVIAAVLVLGFIALWPMLSPNDIKADADKNAKEEILTDDGVIIEDKGWGSSSEDVILITDWDDIPIAKSQIDELLVPEYIPEGYEFQELRVETVDEYGITCTLSFDCEDNSIVICENINKNFLSSLELENVYREETSKKGKIYYKKDNGNKIATIKIDDGIVIDILGNISDDELLKMINNLY